MKSSSDLFIIEIKKNKCTSNSFYKIFSPNFIHYRPTAKCSLKCKKWYRWKQRGYILLLISYYERIKHPLMTLNGARREVSATLRQLSQFRWSLLDLSRCFGNKLGERNANKVIVLSIVHVANFDITLFCPSYRGFKI